MDLHLAKDIEAEITQMSDKHGKRYAVAVIKKSFSIPTCIDLPPVALEKNQKLFYDDVFVDEPGLSPVLFENDFVLKKNKCDIVLNAKAYKPTNIDKNSEFFAGFSIGDVEKVAKIGSVLNDKNNDLNTQEEPIWLHYGSTWGGIWDPTPEDETSMLICSSNPIGMGYIPKKYRTKKNYKKFDIAYPSVWNVNVNIKEFFEEDEIIPCAFTCLARNAEPRVTYAGTYDKKWNDEVFPLLPEDFDERFFQCVPEDQQIEFPSGGEQVRFINLHAENNKIIFHLPKIDMPVVLKDHNADLHKLEAVIDTIQFDLEKQEFSMIWRCHHQLKRSLREIDVAVVGYFDKKEYDKLFDCATGGCGDSNDTSSCGDCTVGEGHKELSSEDSNKIAMDALTKAMNPE